MNRIQRIATAAAAGAAVLAPVTSAVAFAEPYPWHEAGSAVQSSGLTKAQIEHEELLAVQAQQGVVDPSKAQIEHQELLAINEQQGAADEQTSAQASSPAAFPWEAVSLTAFVGAALAAGSVIAVNYARRVPKQA